jgi:hypothetical protein
LYSYSNTILKKEREKKGGKGKRAGKAKKNGEKRKKGKKGVFLPVVAMFPTSEPER